jgi:cation transport ATPase
MVFCPSCGVENEEEATYCAWCGEPIKEGVTRTSYYRRRGEKDEKYEKHEKHEKDEHEKTDTASRNWVALFGLLIVISGVISLLDSWYRYQIWWANWDRLWPLLIITFGLFIVWNVLQARERHPRP